MAFGLLCSATGIIVVVITILYDKAVSESSEIPQFSVQTQFRITTTEILKWSSSRPDFVQAVTYDLIQTVRDGAAPLRCALTVHCTRSQVNESVPEAVPATIVKKWNAKVLLTTTALDSWENPSRSGRPIDT